MKIAVEQYDIRAIHPEKMEEFAEYTNSCSTSKDTRIVSQDPLQGVFFYDIIIIVGEL